jgi:RHH-type proline utilization regulon transcriptional repressor/proline dehydrogenase/delta 1-pyrroline-5-carboxylate dehydrogenase
MSIASTDLQAGILELGKAIFADVRKESSSLLNVEYYTNKILQTSMKNEAVKVAFFRFVDVLPALHSPAEIIEHVKQYFTPVAEHIPDLLQQGLKLSPNSLAAPVVAHAIKKQVQFVAGRFILGDTPQSSLKALRKIRKQKMCFTVDLLGEATLSEAESQIYLDRYLELISILGKEIPTWPESKPLIKNHIGEDTPLNISVKLSALYSQASSLNYKNSIEILSERLTKIALLAKSLGAFVYVDMEDSSLTSITIETFKKVFSSSELKNYPRCGIVLQAYLRRTEDDILEFLKWVQKRGTAIGVRLVKGAYWDTETILAKQKDWPICVWQKKEHSDYNYEKLSELLLKNYQLISPAFASHNIRSLCYAIKAAEALDVPTTRFEIQTLYGMGNPVKKAFVERGYLLREYAPVGELIPGMGYLVRRLLENTSNEGFLRLSLHENENENMLLRSPNFNEQDQGTAHLTHSPREFFKNTPLLDFSLKKNIEAIGESVSKLLSKTSEPMLVEPIVAGEQKHSEKSHLTYCPEHHQQVLAKISHCSVELANEAVNSLNNYFPKWANTSISERADVLFKAAQTLLLRRTDFAAQIILECAKPWAEADADVAEAIDFLNYYALQALELFKQQKLGNYPGEHNLLWYEPRGVTAVIGPWNFPLAIPCGMFSASIVTGNCTVLKPAEQSSAIAKMFFELMLESGLPSEAAAFLPGLGEEVGETLVNHPQVSTIVFTGSKEVGLSIASKASITKPGFKHVKRVVIEMGGKNAIIVDEDADLDEAVKGIIYSAFGYQGQKCSACSRVIVVGEVYQQLLSRLVEATKSIIVGPASNSATLVGPVIDAESAKRLNDAIKKYSADCTVAAKAIIDKDLLAKGHYVAPTVFTDVPLDHELLRTELFGPVVAVIKADSFSKALEIANDSEYGLTGAVFSRSPKNIETAKTDFKVGNLYINRGSTGALVMRQPFGGAKMSGVGSKAGGKDYLHQFVIPRALSENTVRRGFAPQD